MIFTEKNNAKDIILKRNYLILLIFLLLVPVMVSYSQEEEEFYEEVYGLGDQTFTITAGLFHPLFYSTPEL